MSILDIAIKAAAIAVPPKLGDIDEQQRWRWVVFAAIVALCIGTVGHIALACGFLPTVFPGFANVTSVDQLTKEIREDRLERLDRDILQLRALQCHSKTDEQRTQYAMRLQELINTYWRLTKQYPRVPACDEV